MAGVSEGALAELLRVSYSLDILEACVELGQNSCCPQATRVVIRSSETLSWREDVKQTTTTSAEG